MRSGGRVVRLVVAALALERVNDDNCASEPGQFRLGVGNQGREFLLDRAVQKVWVCLACGAGIGRALCGPDGFRASISASTGSKRRQS
jgi:hypothetical protein